MPRNKEREVGDNESSDASTKQRGQSSEVAAVLGVFAVSLKEGAEELGLNARARTMNKAPLLTTVMNRVWGNAVAIQAAGERSQCAEGSAARRCPRNRTANKSELTRSAYRES